MKSRRQNITETLESGPYTLKELSKELCIKIVTLKSDMEHIKLSLKKTGKSIYINPPYCNSCQRDIPIRKIKNIRKCPKCKSENVRVASFFIGED